MVMGILNVTPDSFYPGSRVPGAREALDRALRMEAEGADLIDVGGQSTRPGSEQISPSDELGRVLPVLEKIAGTARVPISIDTDKASVARRAREAGASVLNDITAWRADKGMMEEALKFEAVILMHMKGTCPKTMQDDPRYGDVVGEVYDFLQERKAQYLRAGGFAARLLHDPGIGFGKTLEHNLALLRNLDRFNSLGPVVLGASRKSFLGRLMAGPGEKIPGPEDRLPGSLGVACWAAAKGAAMVRVHDVRETRLALEAFAAARDGQPAGS